MTSMYDEANPSMLAAIANQTVERHRQTPGENGYAPGACAQCTPTGCTELDWARRTLDAYRADRAAQLAATPSW
ncbi:hypothetical protein [Micromonospora chersina]|uniref:hypothetical protein n=1 Tax=Micromonospora chersina TaxID=47854 RepID=UPI003410C703